MPLSRYLPYIVMHTCACRQSAFAREASASGDCLVAVSLSIFLFVYFLRFTLSSFLSFFFYPSSFLPFT